MNKNHLSETAEIKAGNLEDNLTPFKPRPRFGSGHIEVDNLLVGVDLESTRSSAATIRFVVEKSWNITFQ